MSTWLVTLFSTQTAARKELRRQVVTRVLDVVDDLARQQARPVLAGAFRRREIDLALLQTRLLLDLRKRDLIVAYWVWAQTQRILSANKESEATRRAIAIGVGLGEWHRGSRKRRWFTMALDFEPVIEDFVIPRAARWRQSGRLLKETLLGGLAIAGTTFVIQQGTELARELDKSSQRADRRRN